MCRRISFALSGIFILLTFACSSTTFQSSWRNPGAQPLQLRGQKVAAVFVTREPVLRRRAEDALAREITSRGAIGVPSYTFVSDADVRDHDFAKTKADELGCAGAVVMRVVGSRTVYHQRPAIWIGPPYQPFWGGYWGWGWGAVWDPRYLTVDRVVKVETLVYSLQHDQLVWAGVSKTFDPGEVEHFIGELSVAISERMQKDGLIARE